MNHKPPTTEEQLVKFLAPTQDVGLRDTERSVMKSELMTYAQFHQRGGGEKPVAVLAPSHWWLSAMVACSLLLVAGTGTGYAATESTPGDALYAVKVNVVEPLIGFSHLGDTAQLQYQVTLMERRLDEVQELHKDATLNVEEVAIIEAELADRYAAYETILDDDTDASIPSTVVLDSTSHARAVAEALAAVARIAIPPDGDDPFYGVADSAADRYTAEVDQFVATASPEAVSDYISSVLTMVEHALIEEHDLATSSVSELREQIRDVSDAVGRQEFDEALLRAGAARHMLEVVSYIDADVEVETVPHGEPSSETLPLDETTE